MYDAVVSAPFGKVGIEVDAAAGVVRSIVYLEDSVPFRAPDSAIAERAVAQIERYLADAAAPFDLPLAEAGTPFQRRVWQAMCEIPLGSVLTYGALAAQVGGVARAVGQACGDNPFPLVVPCHRVVAANGLGGFSHHAGDGFYPRVKRWLIAHESTQLALGL
ncbi:methylated-DNA--[protein]-cysteine S-methyltransferase [Trinickia sp. NRRL B-1857]|uniref:methylated-DNA--[protein]-cysteine S-methyltransferase n=1 Tax=Trinickia sp. NRRL B-1857 TaxID=3162879 RepID=UPI003D28CA11